jgi:hypothetical protein
MTLHTTQSQKNQYPLSVTQLNDGGEPSILSSPNTTLLRAVQTIKKRGHDDRAFFNTDVISFLVLFQAPSQVPFQQALQALLPWQELPA